MYLSFGGGVRYLYGTDVSNPETSVPYRHLTPLIAREPFVEPSVYVLRAAVPPVRKSDRSVQLTYV
jgi:hypothetical protein